MISGNRVLALIPARGGSKGLPGKNTREMCGKPLIAWSIEKAKQSKYLDTILVSTDSEGIADVARRCGAHVPFLRPAEFATDEANTHSVVVHALRYMKEQEGNDFDLVVLLEPTSPIRQDGDIDCMLEALLARQDDYDSIISVGEVTQHPSIMKRLVDAKLEPFSPNLKRKTRRQDNVPAFFPYGVAYIAKTVPLLEQETFYTRRSTHYLLQRYQHHDIDDVYDFLCAEAVMKYEWGSV